MTIESQKLSPEAAEMLRLGIDRQVESAKKGLNLDQLARIWLTGGDLSETSLSKPTKPYRQVDLVFACITKIITTMLGIPLVLSTVDEKIIESGPAWEVLFKNPLMSFKKFVTDWIGHYALARDVFIVFTESAGIRPTEFLVVSGIQMNPITTRGGNIGELLGWEFRGGGQLEKFTIFDVHQTRNFNPYDRFHGIGPATAAEQSINYTYAAELFNTSALQNGAEPGPILTAQNRMEPEQAQFLRSQFDARHQGPGKAKKTAILTGGLDIKTIAMNMVDMDVANLTTMSDKKICSAFGVPPAVVGLITEAQYAYGPAQEDFIFNTIVPIAELFANEITDGILSRFYTSDFRSLDFKDSRFGRFLRHNKLYKNRAWLNGYEKAVSSNQQVFAWFDYTQHPVVQRVKREQAEQVLKFTNSGVPLNQLIAAHDLPYEENAWGEHWWIPMGQVPADFTLEAGLEGLTGPVLPEGGEEPKSIIKLLQKHIDLLVTLPETGIGYQIVDITLKNGRVLNEKIVLNCMYLQIDNEEIIDPNEIEIIKLHHSVSSVAQNKNISVPSVSSVAKETAAERLWRSWTASWLPIEKEYQNALRLFFIHQQRTLLSKLRQVLNPQSSIEHRATSDESRATSDEVIARVTFDLKSEDNKLLIIHRGFFSKASELGVRQTLVETLQLAGKELNARVEQAKISQVIRKALVRSSQKIKSVNRTTQNMVARELKEGLDAGEGLNDLTNRIRQVLGFNRTRSLTIARLETGSAVSAGRHAGFEASGIQKKSWLSARDNAVRETHRQAESDYAEGIPLEQPFRVGDAVLMYPCDPAGPPEEIINCRCVELAKFAGKEITQFYTYEKMKMEKQRVKSDAS